MNETEARRLRESEASRVICPHCRREILDYDGEAYEHIAECAAESAMDRASEQQASYDEPDPGDSGYEGPDEAKEWEDFDPDA